MSEKLLPDEWDRAYAAGLDAARAAVTMTHDSSDIGTIAHLPECPWADRGYAFPCICDRLRACEQRVREDEQMREYNRPFDEASMLWHKRGYAAGVQAARDAVADVRTWPTALTPANAPIGIHVVVIKDDAIAAIDALKEKP